MGQQYEPENGQLNALYEKAYRLYEEKRFDEALFSFMKLIAQNPQEKSYWFALASTYQALTMYTQAKASWDTYLHIDPQNANAYFEAAKCAYFLGKIEAIDLINQAKTHSLDPLFKQKAETIKQKWQKEISYG